MSQIKNEESEQSQSQFEFQLEMEAQNEHVENQLEIEGPEMVQAAEIQELDDQLKEELGELGEQEELEQIDQIKQEENEVDQMQSQQQMQSQEQQPNIYSQYIQKYEELYRNSGGKILKDKVNKLVKIIQAQREGIEQIFSKIIQEKNWIFFNQAAQLQPYLNEHLLRVCLPLLIDNIENLEINVLLQICINSLKEIKKLFHQHSTSLRNSEFYFQQPNLHKKVILFQLKMNKLWKNSKLSLTTQ